MADVLQTIRDLIAENETLKEKLEASEISRSEEYCDLNGKLRDVSDACERIECLLEESEKRQEDTRKSVTKAMDALKACHIPSDFETMPFKDFKDHITKLECAINSAKSELTPILNPTVDELEEEVEDSPIPSSSTSSSRSSTLTFDEEFNAKLNELGCGTLVGNLLAKKRIVVFGDLVSRVLRHDPIDSVKTIDVIAKDVEVFGLFVDGAYILTPWSDDGNLGERVNDLTGDVPDGWSVFRLMRYSKSTPIRIFVPSSPKKELADVPSRLGVLDILNIVYDGDDVHVKVYTNFLLKRAKCSYVLPTRLTSLGFSASEENVVTSFKVPTSKVFSKTDLEMRHDRISSDLERLTSQDLTLEDAFAKIVESHGIAYSFIRRLLDVEGVYVVGDFVRQALLGEHGIVNCRMHIVSLRGIDIVKGLLPYCISSGKVYDRMNTVWMEDTFKSDWCTKLAVCVTYPDKIGNESIAEWKRRIVHLTRTHAENAVPIDFNIASFDGEEFSVAKLECLLQRRHVSKPSDDVFLAKYDVNKAKSYGYTFDPTPIATTSRILKKDDPFDILLK